MKARHRPKTPEARIPYHVAIAVGVSTGLYAVSLLAATRLQIDTDRALIEDRAPVQGAIDALGDHHAWLERQLDEARVRYTERVAGYDGLASRVQKLDDRLVKMDKTVRAIERLSASLSQDLSLPAVTSGSSRSRGGTTGSAGGSKGGGSTTVKLPKAPPAKPPPVDASTGASGAP